MTAGTNNRVMSDSADILQKTIIYLFDGISQIEQEVFRKNSHFPLDKSNRMCYNDFAQVNCAIVNEVDEMPNKYDAIKLKNQVCFPLYACSKELIRQYTPYLKKLNLTYTQYIVMMVLWEQDTVSSKVLSECLHLDYGTLTPVLKKLEHAGYLTRKRAAEDERLLTITLTEAGRTLKNDAVSIPTAIADCMGLTTEEFQTLYMLTYKALKHMESKE